MTIITLVSGGIDSLVMAKIIKEEGEKQDPLFIDYGQLAREKEWVACKKIFSMSNLPEPTRVDLSGYGKLITSGITDPAKDICKQAFLPGRNLLFLLIGSSYAKHNGADKVAIGLLTEKHHLFPDQTGSFIVNANVAINSALDEYFTIVTPLMNFTKSEVLKLGKYFDLPIHETYSCHSGQDKYCGKCISCKELLASDVGSSLPQFAKGGK